MWAAEKPNDPTPSERAEDLWLPRLTRAHTACMEIIHAQRDGTEKRSASMITFSHFFAKAPATDEAAHTGANHHAASLLLLNPPQLNRINSFFCSKCAEHQM